ncbi:hypothetical protein [Arcanobacterium phocisimile]|uniref:hypothetical protein n=1 Tax=Arcanobacterium phocisimile TaxID=1302235 RepID=UPI001EF92BDF|nr:hypothetical protein [Arcanobacterium phocisimile]
MLIRSSGKGLNVQVGYASAISVILFLLTLFPLLIVGLSNNKDMLREALSSWRNRRANKSVAKKNTKQTANLAAQANITEGVRS